MANHDAHLEALLTVRTMLSGETSLIDGCRRIVRLLGKLEQGLAASEAALTFVAVESETDDYPAGPERGHWDPEVLRQRDAEMERYLASVREQVLDACRQLERKLA